MIGGVPAASLRDKWHTTRSLEPPHQGLAGGNKAEVCARMFPTSCRDPNVAKKQLRKSSNFDLDQETLKSGSQPARQDAGRTGHKSRTGGGISKKGGEVKFILQG